MEKTCFKCPHQDVCYLLHTVKEANEITNVAPHVTRFLASPQSIGGICQYFDAGGQGLRALQNLVEEALVVMRNTPYTHMYFPKGRDIIMELDKALQVSKEIIGGTVERL